MKLNRAYLATLRRLLAQSRRKLLIRFLISGSTTRENDHLPFCRQLAALLGPENVEIHGHLPYTEYMALMEQGELAIGAFHFGGANIYSDTLFLRIPTVVWEGARWYNRFGAAMLRIIGLGELIATGEREYLDLVSKLIHDDAYRAGIQQRLRAVDFDKTLYATADAQYFRVAIDYLIENDGRLQSDQDRSPIRIEQ